MQPTYYKRPYSPTRASSINPLSYGLGNINFDGIGPGITEKITKLSNLLKTRGIPATAPRPIVMNYDYEGDGSVVKYTRQQFDDLYKTNIRRSSSVGVSGDGGYFDKLFFMFQLYIAFINALMNATSMSASMIFGNQSLQNVFSIFLVNVLNMILQTNVAELTPEQLRDLLEKNRPVLQQISRILIDEASQLLVGLSDVCSKIAMDWVQNVLPGLVKSAAVGVPSAIEAAIPPLGELVEIINTGMALLASFMKIVGGVQRNVDNVSQGLSHVKRAYTSLEKIKQLLSQPPSEIVKTATSAVVTPALNDAAQSFLQNVLQPQPQPLSPSPLSPSPLSPSPSLQTDGAPASPSHMRNLFNMGKNIAKDAARSMAREGLNMAANAVSQFLTTPSGTPLTDTTGTPITTSFWNRSWKRLFDMAVEKLKQSKEAMDKIRLNSGISENGRPLASSIIVDYILKHPDILIPYLPAPYNIGAIAFRLVQTYMQRIREQKAANIPAKTSGGGLNKVKSRKYLKNPKQFNRYISNLRKKTAKKELELVNSIQELKSI